MAEETAARLTQVVAEVGSTSTPPAALAQVSLEVISTYAPLGAQVSQVWLEVLSRPPLVTEGLACEPLPDWIAYGATGGPEWGTVLFAAPGGWEQRTQVWNQVRGRWDVSFINVTKEQATILVDFFRAVARGRAGSFCFIDWRDHTFSNIIGVGDGVSSDFQLSKAYISGALSYSRPLTRPIVSGLEVTVNGVLTTAYTVSTTGGMLSFATPPPSGAVIHATGDFEVLVRFESDELMVTCVTSEVFSCTGLGLVELIGE